MISSCLDKQLTEKQPNLNLEKNPWEKNVILDNFWTFAT